MKIYREVKGIPEEDGSEEKTSFDVIIGEATDAVEAEMKSEAVEGKDTEE